MKVIKPTSMSAVDGSITRSTTATYYDESLLLKSAAINEARFNYNPVTGAYEGVLIEGAATNLLTYSEDLWDTTKWAVGSTLANFYTATNETTLVSPRGTTGGVSKFVANPSTASLFLRKGGLSLTATDQSVSIFVYVPSQVGISNFSVGCDFNDTDISFSGQVTSFNKWIRVNVPTKLLTATRSTVDFNITANGTSAVPAGFIFYAFGAQLETASNHSSYIPTVAAAVNRAADVMTGSGLMYTTLTDIRPIWNSGTTYADAAIVRYANKIWESLQGTNLNHAPDVSPTWWIELGPDNMHAAFDNQVSTISTATTSMTFVVKVGSIDSMALINMIAVTADVVMTDPVAGIVAQRKSGLSGAEVYDWYQYFFYDPLLIRTQVIFSDLPSYTNAYITIKITGNVGDNISLALATFGLIEDLGGTQYGATAGIIDYSIKETDDFGNVTFVRRNFSKRLSAQLYVDNVSLNRVTRFLYNLRATPAVWIGADDPQLEEAVVVYGFYKEFSMDIAYPRHSLCSLEIEGLT